MDHIAIFVYGYSSGLLPDHDYKPIFFLCRSDTSLLSAELKNVWIHWSSVSLLFFFTPDDNKLDWVAPLITDTPPTSCNVTCDTWHMIDGVRWTFSQNVSFLALTVSEWRFVEDIFTKDDSVKGNRTFTDLRYGEEDSISPSALFFAATKG